MYPTIGNGLGGTDVGAGVPRPVADAANDHDSPPSPDRKSCFDCAPAVAWLPHSNHRSSVLEAATSAPRSKAPLQGTTRLVQVTPESAVKDSCHSGTAVGPVCALVST